MVEKYQLGLLHCNYQGFNYQIIFLEKCRANESIRHWFLICLRHDMTSLKSLNFINVSSLRRQGQRYNNSGVLTEVSINWRLFGKNLENWSPNGLLQRSKFPYPTINTFLNFVTYIPLTDFETVTNIKCEDRREISSLTKSEKP